MEYNRNNIQKIEHFFLIPKNKGQKKMEKCMFMLLFHPIYPTLYC